MAAMEWSQIMTVYACVQYEEFKCKQTMLTMFNNSSPKSRLTGAGFFVISSLSPFGRHFVYLPHQTRMTRMNSENSRQLRKPQTQARACMTFENSPGPPPPPPPLPPPKKKKCLDKAM